NADDAQQALVRAAPLATHRTTKLALAIAEGRLAFARHDVTASRSRLEQASAAAARGQLPAIQRQAEIAIGELEAASGGDGAAHALHPRARRGARAGGA